MQMIIFAIQLIPFSGNKHASKFPLRKAQRTHTASIAPFRIQTQSQTQSKPKGKPAGPGRDWSVSASVIYQAKLLNDC